MPFERLLATKSVTFYVNLQGLAARGGVAGAVDRAVRGTGGATDWELMRIMDHLDEHPEDASRFTWWNNKFDQTQSPFD